MTVRRAYAVLLALLVLGVACSPPEQAQQEAEEGEPIRIGFLAALSSVSAESAKDMVDGWNLFWDQQGREVAGRKVQVFIEDDAGEPDVALSKARLLVEQRQVDMLVGLLFAHTGLAVADYVAQTGTPTFMPVVSADDLTQRSRVPNVIRVAGWSSSQPHHPFGEWIAQERQCRRAYTIGADYAFGHEVAGGFTNTFTDAGGQILGQLWNPIEEADFSSYLARIRSDSPDCVFAIQVGATATRLLRAWNDFGLSKTIDLYAGEVQGDQSILRGIQPPELAEGLISAGHYAEGRDSQATRDFVETFDEEYGKLPSYYAAGCFTAAQWVAQALEDVNGNVEDRDAFLEAIRNVQLSDTPLGPLRLDQYGNPIQNIYIRQVEIRDDGRPWNVVIDEFPEVSQFYQYDPEQFLEQPVYSRDYQGVDWP